MIIDDILVLVRGGKGRCVSKMIQMCRDLHLNGISSRYLKHFGGPVYELKDRTRDGGARVYFFATADEEFVLVHAECKKEDAADRNLLEDVADVLAAFESGATTGLLSPVKGKGKGQ